MPIPRRTFLTAGGLGLLGAGTGCSDVHSRSGVPVVTPTPDGAVGANADIGPVEGELTFAFWGGSDGEARGFTRAKETFEHEHPKAQITLRAVPYSGFFSGIERGLQAGQAPDVFRVDYTNVGHYASKGVLLDLTTYFTPEEAGAFAPALWKAVQYDGIPYGVPHQIDVTAIAYDKTTLASAGVRSVPTRVTDAWTWEEFADVAGRLRRYLPASSYPFAYDWTKAGAYRWFSWLYQAGGSVMDPHQRRSAVDAPAGREALDFTRSFFTRGWVPETNTIKGAKFSDEFFRSRIVALSFIGDFLVPQLAAKGGYSSPWGVTFMPRHVRTATDLGGNAIVANAATKRPRLAAAFLKHLVKPDVMRYFCEQSNELPTLTALQERPLAYAAAPHVMNVFTEQARTLTPLMTSETASAGYNRINVVMQDELERAFTDHSVSSAEVARAMGRRIDTVLGWRA